MKTNIKKKACEECSIIQSLEAFNLDYRLPDGRKDVCIGCVSLFHSRRHEEHEEIRLLLGSVSSWKESKGEFY